ncbi:recombinase family protein [Nonomuraea wenchangensis]|uniref:Site-specific DNA recombinase n=1 Tax=Nonomuraea wenchangensis TaxID=568860 RepID=A0A1I0F416_9ACTN|nr:recombinase family protein [Nonomuraea wenchangensis]SET52670.1 Site-specific DNA recombinase [Nonomuraea wenchangensis]
MPPEKPQLRAAIYDRVSKDKRRDARSVEEQKVANVTHCDRHGWAVAEIFTDNDKSASRYARGGRPDWERLLEALAGGAFDVLVMWEPSRGGRELQGWSTLLNLCQEQGVLIHITSHDHTYDVRKPRDRRSLAEDGVDSEYESGKISERIRRGTRARAAEGRPHGPARYGYRRVYDPATGALVGQVIEPDEAAVVREMADWVKSGVTLEGIARRLNGRGTPAPRAEHWQAGPIKRMLLHPSYLGYRVHNGERIKSEEWFPPILDEHVHYMLVARLTNPERGGPRPSAVKHLLSGIALCGICGTKLKTAPRAGVVRYTCRSLDGEGRIVTHLTRGKARVDAYVESVTIAVLQQPDALAAMLDGQESTKLSEALARLEKERAELDAFYAKAEAGELSAEGLVRVEAARLPKIRAIEGEVRDIQSVQFMPHVPHLTEDGPEHVPARWRGLDLAQQREVIASLFTVEILPIGSGRKRFADEESVRVTPRRA